MNCETPEDTRVDTSLRPTDLNPLREGLTCCTVAVKRIPTYSLDNHAPSLDSLYNPVCNSALLLKVTPRSGLGMKKDEPIQAEG